MLRFHPILFLIAVFVLAGCAPLLQPVAVEGTAPTPIVVTGQGGEVSPKTYVDTQSFQMALLDALNSRDAARLQPWMTEPFLSGWWRGEMIDESPADALDAMLSGQLSEGSRLKVVEDADLVALMGGRSPFSLPRPEAGVVSAMLVSGWGRDGQDEAVLFISRRPDNSLKWHGVLRVPGGFTSQPTGGVQQYTNQAHGYSLFIPQGFEVQQPTANQVTFLGSGEGHRERGFITVEPANGRTAEEVASAVKEEQPPALNVEAAAVLGIEGEQAYILNWLSGQNLNRQVFVVHHDVLYRMMFVPQDPEAGEAYRQMENLYATVINTFHFLPRTGRITALPITDLEQFEEQLRRALEGRDTSTIRALMGDSFVMAFWQSEGIDVAPAEAAQQIIVRFVPPGAPLTFENSVDIPSRFQGIGTAPSVAVPASETVLPVFVSGWGLEGKDQAVFFISKRMDGSLYWKGVLTAQGGFPQPAPTPQQVGEIPVTATQVQYVIARKNLNIRGGPGLDFRTVGVLAQGQTAQVTGASTDGLWWRVVCRDNSIGNCWVSADAALSQPVAAPGR